MSTQEPLRFVEESSRSSIKLTKNAKGDMQQEVKVYEDCDSGEINRILGVALAAYRLLDASEGATASQVAHLARPEER